MNITEAGKKDVESVEFGELLKEIVRESVRMGVRDPQKIGMALTRMTGWVLSGHNPAVVPVGEEQAELVRFVNQNMDALQAVARIHVDQAKAEDVSARKRLVN